MQDLLHLLHLLDARRHLCHTHCSCQGAGKQFCHSLHLSRCRETCVTQCSCPAVSLASAVQVQGNTCITRCGCPDVRTPGAQSLLLSSCRDTPVHICFIPLVTKSNYVIHVRKLDISHDFFKESFCSSERHWHPSLSLGTRWQRPPGQAPGGRVLRHTTPSLSQQPKLPVW